jgi:hypothetical protein
MGCRFPTSTLDLNLPLIPQERLADPNMADYILIFIHLGLTIGEALALQTRPAIGARCLPAPWHTPAKTL